MGMAQINPAISHITPTTTLCYFLLLLFLSTTPILAITNITALLSSFPDFSSFTSLLASTPSITSDLSNRSALTLLVIPNSYLSSSLDLTRRLSPSSRTDLLRYHILLQYLSSSDLHHLPPAGALITTLFQTTGRASANFGSVNITRNPVTNAITISSPSPFSSSNATVLSLIKTLPYNVSIISVNSLLVPYGFDLMASETRPPLGLNITKALLDGHNFFVAASLLSASGVVQEFEADEGGAGITLFVPTDSAFADLSENDVSLQSLPADKKADVLKFHVLHSYYPLGSLESIVNPVQPTLATEDMGIVLASVTQTVFDQNPVAIFGVSKVLLPKEIFGSNPVLTSKPGNSDMGNAQPPAVALSPESSPKMLSSAPGAREEIKSGVGGSQWLSNLPFLCVVAEKFEFAKLVVVGLFCLGVQGEGFGSATGGYQQQRGLQKFKMDFRISMRPALYRPKSKCEYILINLILIWFAIFGFLLIKENEDLSTSMLF
ncbi:FASCICLIN-LIKE ARABINOGALACTAN PROTEIN 4 [Salix purpurea]|uniref:FASCICLIN-LIKE ARABINOGALACTAN PROTEIN 4 n=1 Tax=Salix purpurea TaxID=77065 RepID=A0A9Q0Q2C2_SALPP|nr:FASCICLIN-LIKE ARABINOGALACTAN PROTEIN 4 [Salix purpurea]